MHFDNVYMNINDFLEVTKYLLSIRFHATSLQEKFKLRFLPTRRLHTSSNLSSSRVKILKTARKNMYRYTILVLSNI